MTRLQTLLIKLSECRTIEELETQIGTESVDEFIERIGFTKDKEVKPCFKIKHCSDCLLNDYGCETDPRQATIKFLNEETHTHNQHKSTINIIQEKAMDVLKFKMFDAYNSGMSPLYCALSLDALCDLLEEIGLFAPDECHNRLLEITKKRNPK